jgi:integrase
MPARIFGAQIQVELYGKDSVEHFKRSKYIQKFLAKKAVKNPNTATTYKSYLMNFANFVFVKYKPKEVDDFIEEIKKGEHDPYEILSQLSQYLTLESNGRFSSNSINFMVVTSRKFLRQSGIKIDIEDFKELVDMPRKFRTNQEAIDRKDIVDILNACKQTREKITLLFLAATGARATEGMSIRMSDLKLEADPPTVTFRAENTKTKVERTCYLTEELVKALKVWLKIKYQAHRRTFREAGKERQEFVTPQQRDTDLVFAYWSHDGASPEPKNIYNRVRESFTQILDILEKGKWQRSGKRRTITLHSFRRYVKTAISNAGYAEFSEWYLGHSGSPYWKGKENEKVNIFRRIEDRLTYLDIANIEAKHADQQSRIEALEAQLVKERNESELKMQNMIRRMVEEEMQRRHGKVAT